MVYHAQDFEFMSAKYLFYVTVILVSTEKALVSRLKSQAFLRNGVFRHFFFGCCNNLGQTSLCQFSFHRFLDSLQTIV